MERERERERSNWTRHSDHDDETTRVSTLHRLTSTRKDPVCKIRGKVRLGMLLYVVHLTADRSE